jgi:hypothetical protein
MAVNIRVHRILHVFVGSDCIPLKFNDNTLIWNKIIEF